MTEEEMKKLIAEFRKKNEEMCDILDILLVDDNYRRISGHLCINDILAGIDPDWDRL